MIWLVMKRLNTMTNFSKLLKKFCGLALVVSLSLGCFAACNNPQVEETKPVDYVVNEGIVDSIKERGYLVVGCKMDVPNLGFYDEGTEVWSGLEIELAYKIAAKIWETDIQNAKESNLVHFVGVTVADREDALLNGEIDLMIATYTITPERQQRFAISNSYYTDYVGIMVRDYGYDANSLGDSSIRSIADLDGKYIGVPRRATTRDAFIEYSSSMTTVNVNPIFCEYDTYQSLYDALMAGEIDAMSVDVSILNGYLDVNTLILQDRFAAQHYGVAALNENCLLIDLVNEVI